MGFFDQIGKKASDTMQSAKEKTNRFSAEMKLKSKISDKKDRINTLYLEIGKEVYSNYLKEINENTESIIAKVEEISDINKELNDMNKELLNLKGIKICTSCGGQIPVGSDFCPKCGNKVVEIKDSVPESANSIDNQGIENIEEENKTE